jgi:glycosyltransferase involved in cell wall biosynthesis
MQNIYKHIMPNNIKHMPLSAVIITQDEARNIQRCLNSVAFCDDIIVVDSGSSDDTVQLANMAGARVIHQDWLGYGKQKQFAVKQAKHDWVLCIDADEVVSDELRHSIQRLNLTQTSSPTCYQMPRRNHFLGKALFHGEGYPDYSLRLFNRTQAQWSDDQVHEGVKTTGNIATLTGDLLHFSGDTIATYLHKQNHYTELQAHALYKAGKYCSASKCFTSPFIRFIKFYIFRLGCLDGAAGFIHITIGCFNAFSKYAKLLELQRQSTDTSSHIQ